MATNTNITPLSTGYDVQVIGDYSPQLNCGICTLIIKHAMHGCTKHAFCKGCIDKYIECGIRTDDGNVKCPGGCNIIINPSKLEPNHFADRMVNTLRTKCSNVDCPWQGDLLDLVQVHQTKCEYATQVCVNNGCIANYLNKDAEQHDEVCLFKTIQCSYCCTDMIRRNKDSHEIECLNEEINCKYYHIGCKKQLCRKDIHQHDESHQIQHMALIYQNLLHQNNEISVLKQHHITSSNEVAILKQQIISSNNEVFILEEQKVTSNNEISILKQQVITSNNEICILKQQNSVSRNENVLLRKKLEELVITTNKEIVQLHQEFQDLKKENHELLEKIQSINKSSEIVVPKELAKIELKSKVFDIKGLKTKLSVARDMNGKVSFINNDQIMIVKCQGKLFNLNVTKLSECYTNNRFDYLFDLYGLNHHKDLMVELFDNIPYHCYVYESESACGLCFTLVFPLDLNNIKNMDIIIPHQFRITIINNQFMVEKLNKHYLDIFLSTGGCSIQLKYSKKHDLQRLPHSYSYYEKARVVCAISGCINSINLDWELCDAHCLIPFQFLIPVQNTANTPFFFAPGYACLELYA